MGDVIDRYPMTIGIDPLRSNNEASLFYVLILWLYAAVLAPAMILPGKALAATLPASEFVVPAGPVITLQDGQRIDGHIIEFDQTNVIIRTTDGVEQTLPRATIDTVRFETVTGMEIAGALIGWKPGVYELSTDDAVVTVYSTVAPPPEQSVVADNDELPTVEPETDPPETDAPENAASDDDGAQHDGSEEAIIEAAAKHKPDPAQADHRNGVISEAAAATAEGGGDIEAAPAGQTEPADGLVEEQLAALPPIPDLEIDVSSENARENGAAVGFNIKLSRPSENSVVLIYATIDGTAVDGEDYVAARGVLVIKAGETTARIEAPMIDDDLSEDDEDLQLFLTADPAVAVVKNRKIVATIEDDDRK